MAKTGISIKNMVCQRCVKVVRDELTKAGFTVHDVVLGRADVDLHDPKKDMETIRRLLESNGFALLEDQNVRMVEHIKQTIIELVQSGQLEEFDRKLSDYLVERVHRDYHSMSSLFSSVESVTIEKYFILQKIEKIKEWLAYNEWTLSEMAYKLGYSSVAHLSRQFRDVTGMTPSDFKRAQVKPRKGLDEVTKKDSGR
jgi:AraC-like DNA-binding protein